MYADSTKDYHTIGELGETVKAKAINALAKTLPADSSVIVAQQVLDIGTLKELVSKKW